jgi:signal transduction histidine kinase
MGLAGRIAVSLDLAPDLPAVRADRTLLGRALTNLVENAVQAMPAGGQLTVRARADERSVIITVADTGVGMDATALERAFEPYFSTKTGGSGLGLANARRHIELHDGTIAMTSAPGAGTTVTVTLPRADAGAPPSREGAAPPSR